MSEILIKGIEMPKSCESCKFCWRGVATGTFCKINGKMISEGYASFDSRDINCPLVELPPHGRLIDADAFKAYCQTGLELINRELHGDALKLAVAVTESFCKERKRA